LHIKKLCGLFFAKNREIKAVAQLGLPVVVNQASLALMQFTDAWIAGRLGTTEQAAILPASVLISLLAIFGMEALTMVTAQVSQSVGKGRPAAAGIVTWQGIYAGALFGWLCLIYYPTGATLFRTVFGGQSERLIALETQYFQVSLMGLAPLMISTALGNCFTGLGRTWTLMKAAMTGILSNVVLSWALTFGKLGLPEMGFTGIAWGTLIATTIQACVLFALFLGPRHMRQHYGTSRVGFSKKRFLRLLRTGLPAGLHGAVDYLAWGAVLTWLISFSGEAHQAAQSIMVRCITLSFLPADGMASALTTLVGKATGARDYLLARRYTQAGFTLIAGWMTTVALIYFVFGKSIVKIFTDDPAVIAAGSTAILWVAAFQFFDAMNVTYTNALQGAGDTAWPGAVNLTLSLTILLGGGFAVVTWLPGTASSGVWAVATFYIFCQGMIFHRRWRTRAWQNPAFIS
jgi:multidrug resistance protein, MATE family